MFTTSKTELEETARELETTSQRLATTKGSLESTRRDLYQTSVEREQKNLLLQEHVAAEQTLLGQAGQVIFAQILHTSILSTVMYVLYRFTHSMYVMGHNM